MKDELLVITVGNLVHFKVTETADGRKFVEGRLATNRWAREFDRDGNAQSKEKKDEGRSVLPWIPVGGLGEVMHDAGLKVGDRVKLYGHGISKDRPLVLATKEGPAQPCFPWDGKENFSPTIKRFEMRVVKFEKIETRREGEGRPVEVITAAGGDLDAFI